MKKFYFSAFILLLVYSVNITAQSPIYFEPSTLEATLNTNSSVEVHTVLHNATAHSVEFSFPGSTTKDQGGPDSFGYSWIDSDEDGGPVYEWNDISESGILVAGLGDDTSVGPFEMNFVFPFYGQEKNHFWINSNGSIGFNHLLLPFANESIPTNNDYTDFIAWFWDDLTIDSALTSVYYQNFEEKTIIQFNKMVHFPGSTSFVTAQVVMFMNGTLTIRYKLVSEGFDTTSATIGLQSSHPDLGLPVAINETYIHSELAIRFNLNPGFISSLHPASLTLQPGSQETIWITYSSEGFDTGNYEQELRCVTSNIEFPELFVHNVMHVAATNPAGFKGFVTNASNGLPLNDVKVSVGEHYVFTNGDGHYELPLDQGSYNVQFQREGFQTLLVHDTTASAGFSTLDVQLENFYFLVGHVYAGENPIESGFAYGYQMQEGTVVDIFAEMVGVEGWYEFSGLQPANYIVKAEPSPTSEYYGNYLPTYYGDVLHWENATIINLNANTDNAHIHLIAISNAPQGSGVISGTIQSENRAANIPIILRSIDFGSAMTTFSSSDGSFSFTNLAFGRYEIFAEIPGISVIPQPIELNELHTSSNDIDMVILGNEIIFIGITESEIFDSLPVVYPNPVKSSINLFINLKKPADVNIQISDLTGRVVHTEQRRIINEAIISLNANALPKGSYFIRCEVLSRVSVLKFVKN